MINWQRHAPGVKDLLERLPTGYGVEEACKVVGSHLGGEYVTPSALRHAMRHHFGVSTRDLLGAGSLPEYILPSVRTPVIEAPANGQRGQGGADTDLDDLGPIEAAQGLPVAQSLGMLKVMATGDWHCPYHDDLAMETFFAAVEKVRPDVVVLLGDQVDCFTLSTFDKSPDRLHSFSDEIRVTNSLLDRLEAYGCKVHFIEGNHEFRLQRYMARKAPELWGLVGMPELLKLEQRGWTWHKYRGEALRIGKMSFKHDVGKCGKYAAFHSLEQYGGNITFGHTHRGGTVYQGTSKGSQRVALNTGWLGDVEAVDYQHIEIARTYYQHGFGLVYVDLETGNVFPSFHAIVKGCTEINGALVRGG